MKAIFLIGFMLMNMICFGQNKINNIINDEYEQGHFNGSVLVVKDGKIINRISKGYANFQFKVPIDSNTRFPVASVTKLFTTIAILQLSEKSLVGFNDSISKYIDSLPASCRNITVRDLLIHYSGLANEPIKAYSAKYKINDFIKLFVSPKQTGDSIAYNYNNVDYVLLSKIIENVTNKSYQEAIQSLILTPAKMNNTGFVQESSVIPYLAYGYHNYSFGSGKKGDTLYNDRRYLSNYYGAGQMYATTQDLYRLLTALKENKLISKATKADYLTRVQKHVTIDWAGGEPTFGFYYNDRTYPYPVLRRSGNIDGFNADIICDKDFSRIVIILCNTDTADLSGLTKKIFNVIR